MDVLSLVRENIKRLKPYSTARDEFMGVADVYLDANENPFPSNYNRYPDPLQRKLKDKIAEIKGLPADQIFLGNGSDEAIDLLIRAFCEPSRDSILITEPTYGMYRVCAEINDVTVKSILLTPDFDLDTESVEKQLNPSVKLIFLCSPNNPTGNLLSKKKIVELTQSFKGIVVLDEAYIDFADESGFVSQLASYPNLVILQTFSKAWGLAGLRIGMAFASKEIIGVLNKIKYPYNVNSSTQHLVLEKLHQVKEKNEQVEGIKAERLKVTDELSSIRFVKKIYPSQANFILIKMNQAKAVYQYLINERIIVRDRSAVALCDDCLRITIGTQEENKLLIQAFISYEKSIVY